MRTAATLAEKAQAKAQSGDAEREAEVLPRLLSRYVLLRLLVRGGMGEVYLATTIGIEGAERPVVVKRIRREYRQDPSFHARFLDEARVQAQLDDPGVARIVEAAVDENGDPHVVVEYVEGRSLSDVRSRLSRLGKPLAWADAVAVTLEIASALAHCHERTGADGAPLGIVHRDLSPQNVMVGFSGDVKLIDFGTARGDNRRCHTVSGTVLAKPGYVAPEVARGDSATARADIYALGVMLWELVAGRRFLEGDAADHVAAVTAGKLRPTPLSGDPTLATQGDGPVPAELDRIVAWLTEPVASQRCGRARDAAQALVGLLSTAPRRPVEERGVRARVKTMLARLYPTEPAASRVEFARLVAKARRVLATELEDLSRSSGAPTRREEGRREESYTPEPQTQVPDALPGTRYRLIRRVGEGAMGVVYEAEHVDLGRKVAVKVLQGKHSQSPEFVARFRREARAIASLPHPNLVQVFDFGQTAGDPAKSEWGGRLFFVMERLEGETLDDFIEREKGADWRDACELGIKICRALEAAHSAGLVHRDLKPANLFLCYAGRRPASLGEVQVKLLDFGVAKEMRGAGAPPSASEACGQDDPNLSRAGAIFGTPETMSPEQCQGLPVDGRADLYALGCVLYNLVTGRTPFDAPSPILMMSCHMRERALPVREAAPLRGIPAAVERLIMRALEKNPEGRFSDATEMREALEEACYGGFFVDSKMPPLVEPFTVSGEHADTIPSAEGDDDAIIPVMVEEQGYEPIVETTRVERPRRRRSAAVVAFAALAGCAIAAFMAGGRHGAKLDLSVLEKLRGTKTTLHPEPAPVAPIAVLAAAPAPASAPPVAPPRATVVPVLTPEVPPLLAAVHHPTKAAKASHPVQSAAPQLATPVSSPVLAPEPVVDPVLPAAAAAPKPTTAEVDAKIAAGETAEALTLARTLKDDGTPASAAAWARAAFAGGHHGEAHDACVAWIARQPASSEARVYDARALRALGRIDEARARLHEVLEANPAHREAKSMIKDLDLLQHKAAPAPAPSPAKHLHKKKKGPQKLLG